MNRIRRENPLVVRNSCENRYNSYVLKNNQCTLTVYQGKPKKNGILLSTVHRTVAIGNDPKKIPEMINFYNYKIWCRCCWSNGPFVQCTKVASWRWPIQVFYNILDLAAINAVILYEEVTCQTISCLQLAVELQKSFKADNARGHHYPPTQHTTTTHPAPSPTHYHIPPATQYLTIIRLPFHCTLIPHHSMLSLIQPAHPQPLLNPFILLKHSHLHHKHIILLFPASSSHHNPTPHTSIPRMQKPSLLFNY